MESQHLQQIFFEELSNQLSDNISLADEISNVLKISIDGAYRRIRGEKLLSFKEIQFLALKYKISVDHLFNIKTNSFSFSGSIVSKFDFTYEKWLKNIASVCENISQQPNHHVYYFVKEIPYPYYFYIPEIAAFTSFYFMKFFFCSKELVNKRFSINDPCFEQYKRTWQTIKTLYSKISCTEIWNVENFDTLINRILCYTKIGLVEKAEAAILLEKTEELMDFIKMQAEQGTKLNSLQNTTYQESPQYDIYVNNQIVGDNSFMVQYNESTSTFVVHSAINFINTTDDSFNAYMKKTMGMFLKRSIPISIVNENERLNFFNSIENKINTAKQKVTCF